MKLINTFRKHLREATAEVKGQAVSRAVRIKPLAEFGKKLLASGRPTPTGVRTKDVRGRIYEWYTDGSLRRVR